MKNKIIALALVGVMLSVCFAGVFSYADDADAIVGMGTKDSPYNIGSVELTELKDKAVVYFNLSYDKQYLSGEIVTDIDSAINSTVLVPDLNQETDYRFKGELKAKQFTEDVSGDVVYKITLTYAYVDANNKSDYTVSEDVYYKVSVTILKSNNDPSSISMKFEGNVIYNGKWTLVDGTYTGDESEPQALFSNIGTRDSFYSSDLPKGLYLKNVSGGATIAGMIGSEYGADVGEREFHIYQITDKDVVVTTVKYTVDKATSGPGFTYSVSDKEDNVVLDGDVNDDKIIIVKSGTELKITTNVKLTQFKTVDQIGKTYNDAVEPSESDSKYTYTLSNNVSGTVKVFMTYNNGINDNCTKVLTIIYIGSTADASLSNPVVRSY